MRNIFLRIAYDGHNFNGFQIQNEHGKIKKDKRTVEGVIKVLLENALKESINIIGCSRTDTGVSANDYVLNFFTKSKIPFKGIKKIIEDNFAGTKNAIGIGACDIYIKEIKEVNKDFHARHNAKKKRYIYKIFNPENKKTLEKNLKEPFKENFFLNNKYKLVILKKLDIIKMRKASKYFLGEHDFKAFKTSSKDDKEKLIKDKNTFVREIKTISIKTKNNDIIISIEGNGFLYNMCRIIVGTLLEVGLNKRTPISVKETLEKKDRKNAGVLAPAHALYLDEVFY